MDLTSRNFTELLFALNCDPLKNIYSHTHLLLSKVNNKEKSSYSQE